jgi:PKD domain/Bacterial Ig domain
MNTISKMRLTGVLLSLLLTACGGAGSAGSGGSGGGSGPVNTAPIARAGTDQSVLAGSVVSLDGTSSSDAESDPLTYSWSLVARPADSAAVLSAANVARPQFTADKPGTYSLSVVVSDGKLSSSAGTVTVVVVAAPQINLDKVEPLSGTVKLSLSSAVTTAVTWYVDLNLLGTGSATDGGSFSWNTSGVSNNTHLLVARIATGQGSYVDVRRSVQVGNSSITLAAGVSASAAPFTVTVTANSTYGISNVSLALDGQLLGTLTAPNSPSPGTYRFNVTAAQAPSGPHTLVITAQDNSGSTQQLTRDLSVANAPQLTLNTPAAGALVYGSLVVSGTATSDAGSPLTITATLNGLQILQTSSSPFGTTFDLTGVAPGNYTLTVRAVDGRNLAMIVERPVVVASSLATAPAALFTLPAGGDLLAGGENKLLYATGDGGIRLRDLTGAGEVTLANTSTLTSATDWQISGGRVYVSARGADCVAVCIFEWDAGGTQRNLSNANPYSLGVTSGRSSDLHPVARSGFVLWANWLASPNAYTLYDVANQSYRQILSPVTSGGIGNIFFDLAVNAGVAQLVFWNSTGSVGNNTLFDIFRWSADSGAYTRLTNDASARNIYPATDGVRVAWQKSPLGGNSDGSFSLMVQPLAGGAVTTAALSANSFLLRDGVLAWLEAGSQSPTVYTVRALGAGSTSTLLAGSTTANLLAVGSGFVAYAQAGNVYTWNAVSGSSALRVNTSPVRVLISGAYLVFSVNQQVYRVSL